jgi:quinol monooxygenase YgiN
MRGPIGVSVVWSARPGCEAEVEALLREMRERTLEEPGCREYHVHRLSGAGRFLLYEQYDDAAAVAAHHASAHYRELVQGRAAALVLHREILRGELLDVRSGS